MREVVDGILQRHIEIFLYFLIRNSGLAIKTRSMLENSVLNTRLKSAVEAHRECHLSRGEERGVSPRWGCRAWSHWTNQSKGHVGLQPEYK